MVEAVYPKYTQFIDTGGYVFYDLVGMAPLGDTEAREALQDYLGREKVPFIETMKNSVNFMSDNRHYFAAGTQRRICTNNVAIQIGMRLMEPGSPLKDGIAGKAWQEAVRHELESPYYIKDMISCREAVTADIVSLVKSFRQEGDTATAAVACRFMLRPYLDNFNAYGQELTPNDDLESHLWRHILMLVACVLLGLAMGVVMMKTIFKTCRTDL